MTLFRSLANRSFALLLAGQTVSRIGDFLYQIALTWWVLEKTGSAAAMGEVMICAFAPTLLFLLIGGSIEQIIIIGICIQPHDYSSARS